MKVYVFGLCFLSGLFSAPAFAQEAPAEPIPNIYISEINWAGSSLTTADEWIELYNAAGQSVDLSGWVLTGAATSGNALGIAAGFSAAPGSTVLISNYALGNEKTTLNVEPNLVTSSLSLPNSNLSIMLVMPDGTVVDEVTEQLGTSSPAVSMVRQGDGTWVASSSSLNLLDPNQLGTPGTHGGVTIETPLPLPEGEPEGVGETDVEPEPVIETEPQASPDPSIPGVGTPIDPPPELEPAPEPEPPVEAPIEPVIEVVEPTSTPEPTEPVVTEETVPDPVVFEEPTVIEPEEAPLPLPEEEPTEVVEAQIEPVAEPTTTTETHVNPVVVEDPTPTASSSPQTLATLETVETLSESILINEIVSDPVDGIEFIELYNAGDTDVDLTGWSVKDAAGKATTITGTIAKQSYFVIENPKGKLNNDGDDVILNDENGNVVDQISYGDETAAPDSGESLARDGSSFVVTTKITKGAANILPELEITTTYENDLAIDPVEVPSSQEDEPEVVQDDIETSSGSSENVSNDTAVHKVVAIATPASVKTTKASTKTSSKSSSSSSSSSTQTITGMVTALPGTFGSQIAFIDGIQLYFYYADWPELAIGDVVTVRGVPSTSRGEPRIKIASANDITILRHEEPSATSIFAGSLINQKEGALVSVTGRIIEQGDDKIVLRDDSGEITIVAHKNTGINWLDYSGGEVTIVGVVRSFDDGVMLYPRSAEDVTLVEQTATSSSSETIAPVASSKPIYPYVGGGLAAIAVGALAYWYVTSRKFALRTPQLNHSTT